MKGESSSDGNIPRLPNTEPTENGPAPQNDDCGRNRHGSHWIDLLINVIISLRLGPEWTNGIDLPTIGS